MIRSLSPRAALLIAVSSVAWAQQSGSLPPVRSLGSQLAATREPLGSAAGVRQLSDGRLLVNDATGHRLVLFDSALANGRVIADTTPDTRKAYGSGPGRIIAYLGDSTVLVDPVALSLVIIDPAGGLGRTVSAPRPGDAMSLAVEVGHAAFDSRGLLVYGDVNGRCSPRGCTPGPARHVRPTATPAAAASPLSYTAHDSVAVLRADLATHRIDTVGYVAKPFMFGSGVDRAADGTPTIRDTVVLLPNYDDWALMADGSVAFVRGFDYHIDWLSADGTRSSSPKVPHEWHRLSDDDKQAIIDSARHVVDSADRVNALVQARADSLVRAKGGTATGPVSIVHVWPSPADLPDYRPIIPVLTAGAVRADADNNLWIRETPAVLPGGAAVASVYDVVDRGGRLIDRITVPAGLTVVGFGRGVVYVSSREAWGTSVAKYRIRSR